MVITMIANEAVHVVVDNKNNAATGTPIATVWATIRDKFFAAKTDHPIPAIAAAEIDFCSIVKHGLKAMKKGCQTRLKMDTRESGYDT